MGRLLGCSDGETVGWLVVQLLGRLVEGRGGLESLLRLEAEGLVSFW